MFVQQVKNALEVLRGGGLILYPTDTIWGIGCDATNAEAVAKVYALKGRPDQKSMIILLDTANKLQSYVNDVPDIAFDLIEFSENPLTIIYSNARNLAPNVVAADGSIGIRVVRHEFCEQLIGRFRKPIVSTSANISGEPSPESFAKISPEIINGVDYVVDWEQHKSGPARPSTIMKLQPDGQFSFIRR